MKKLVNGVEVDLSPEEEAAIQAEWAQFEATRAARADAEVTRQFDGQKLVKALAIWTAQKLNVPLAQARTEILTIFRGL